MGVKSCFVGLNRLTLFNKLPHIFKISIITLYFNKKTIVSYLSTNPNIQSSDIILLP